MAPLSLEMLGKKADNVYKKTGVIFNFKIFWPKYANLRHFS